MVARRNEARIIAAMIAFALGSGAATLQFRSLTADLARLRALKAEVVKAAELNASARAVAQKLPELQGIRQRSARRVPPDANLGPMLEALSQFLSRLGLVPEELLTQSTVEGKRYNQFPVSLRFRGNFIQTYEVLKHLRRSERLIRVEKLKIDDPGDGSGPRVQIDLSAFAGTTEGNRAWLRPN